VLVAEHPHGEVGLTATQVDRGMRRHHVDAQVRETPTQRCQGAHHVSDIRSGIRTASSASSAFSSATIRRLTVDGSTPSERAAGASPPRVRHGQQELEIVPVHEIPRR
jgi:hypothetical protein